MTKRYIGVDIGGTGIKAALVENGAVVQKRAEPVKAMEAADVVIDQVRQLIQQLYTTGVNGIGIGIPGLVNPNTGLVYDVMNIPAWKELDLAGILKADFPVQIALQNDANCFALGAFETRRHIERTSLAALTIGTGLGTGLVINGELMSGLHGGAGEFGLISYQEHDIEYYASGRFFENCHQRSGLEVFEAAQKDDPEALLLYAELGKHLANALKTIMYAVDINYFILGGSVSGAWPYFSPAMLQELQHFSYQQALATLVVEQVTNPDAALLGAAALVQKRTV